MTPQELKNSILQLAIQGKLVEQKPEEGTAEELYQQIQGKKKKLIKDGKIKKQKSLPEITEDEIPFDIPDSWKWVRWGNISESIQYGYNASAKGKGRIRMVRISDIHDNTVEWDTVPYCDIKEEDIPQYLLHDKDILFARTGGTVGKSFLVKNVPEEAIYAGYLIRTRYSERLVPEYLKFFMESSLYWSQLRGGTIATAQPNCNGQTLSKMILPLPPFEEQRRIVAKIEELLLYIDKYEKAWNKLEEFNKKFPDDMQKSILQMAIQGKLVEQRHEEGTADELYKQIQEEKKKFIKEGKIKKQKELSEILEDEIPFDIPESWKWCYLGEIFNHVSGKALNAKNTKGSKHKYITTSNVYWNHFELDNLKEMYYTDDEIEKYSLKMNDLLVLEGGDVGRTAIWNSSEAYCIQNHIHRLRPYIPVSIQYFYYVMMYLKKTGTIAGKGIGIKGLSAGALHKIIIPLPPLEEQNRIVTKVEELLNICEKLK